MSTEDIENKLLPKYQRMAAALIPMALMAAGAIPNFISGILGSINEGKRLRGGRLGHRVKRHARHRGGKMHKRKVRHIRRYKRGRGVVSDTLGQIPLLGALLGPLAKALGGRIRRHHLRKKGRGLAPMYMQRPYAALHHGHGYGLAPYGIHRQIGTGGKVRGHYRRVGRKRIHVKAHKRIAGSGLAPMYISRPYVGMGLLAPAGGKLIHRKGYYKHVGRKRIHVRPTTVHHRGTGGRLLLLAPPKKKGY